MTDDRSERLRKRRKRSANKGSESASESDSPDPDSSSRSDRQSPDDTPDKDSNQETASQDEESNSVKQNQTGTYMYLPNSQVKDLSRVYNVLKAQYEYEFDDTFEKNRHFYPLVIKHGLNSLDEMDPSEIRDRLDELP